MNKSCSNCRHFNALDSFSERKTKQDFTHSGACDKLGFGTSPGSLRCGGDDWEAPFLRVCAWCLPGAKLAEVRPDLAGKQVSHGICDDCMAKIIAENELHASQWRPKGEDIITLRQPQGRPKKTLQ
jgi:hypothetical protein